MAFTLEDLLPEDQQLRTVQPYEPVQVAINVMYQHGYSQLPVTGPGREFQGQVITFEYVLRASSPSVLIPELFWFVMRPSECAVMQRTRTC